MNKSPALWVRFAFRIFSVCLVWALSLVLIGQILFELGKWSGAPDARDITNIGTGGIGEGYDMYVSNQVSDALDGVLAVKKHYWISQDQRVAPRPNPSCYGETDDPSQLQWLLDQAAELLDGQEFYFSTDTQIMPGSTVKYYYDETILAITWKQGLDYGAYTFSEVKIAHPSQFRRFLADGKYGSEKLFFTTEMAENVHAVVAASGDFYKFRHAGVIVYDQEVRRVNNWAVDTCYIDFDGEMHFTGVYDPMTEEEAQKFVDDNNINFSLAFGPILIRDSCVVPTYHYAIGEIDDEYPRQALCRMGKLHYLVAAVNSEGSYRYVPDIFRFARNLQATGCTDAYALDGGQTASIVMDDELMNAVLYGYQRKISDIIYFATAIPNN